MTSAWNSRSVASVTAIVMSAGLALAIAAPQATTTQAGQAGQGRAGGAATTGTAAAPDRRAARDQQQQARCRAEGTDRPFAVRESR